jgi:putative FmdB family regulatory protein
MARYDYECPGCGNVVEIVRGFNDPEEDYDCPTKECGNTLVRKYSATPTIFKAAGFYSTDNFRK